MSWTAATKQIDLADGFLLKEDAFYLLLETGDKIALDTPGTGWLAVTRTSSGSWTAQTKNT